MSALSDLEKELGLPAFDILFFKESDTETKKTKKSATSKNISGNKTSEKEKSDFANSEPQSQFNDILSDSQKSRIEKMLKYIQ